MNLVVHPLDVGDLQLDMTFWAWQIDAGTPEWRPTTAWLILGGDKPILVDTSFRSVADAASMQGLVARRSAEQGLASQLARHGLEPGDVKIVVHTHLHMDHAGQDILLPEARVLVRRAEMQNAAAPNIYPVPFYDRLNVARIVHELWERVEVLDGDVQIAPGVCTRFAPGHTPGHQAVIVDTNQGQAIIAGDAAMDLDLNVREGIPPGYLDSMSDTMTGLRDLARADADGSHVLCTHDAQVRSRALDASQCAALTAFRLARRATLWSREWLRHRCTRQPSKPGPLGSLAVFPCPQDASWCVRIASAEPWCLTSAEAKSDMVK